MTALDVAVDGCERCGQPRRAPARFCSRDCSNRSRRGVAHTTLGYTAKTLPAGPLTRRVENAGGLLECLGDHYWTTRTGRPAAKAYHTAKRDGKLTPAAADKLAVRLGLHPADIWGNDWWTA